VLSGILAKGRRLVSIAHQKEQQMSHTQGLTNPFRQFRAEQFEENLWTYYVSDPFDNLLGSKPLVVEGSRGSGKTMFFRCNSWREMRHSLSPASDSLSSLIDPERFIGLYYRVDTPFVSALAGSDLPQQTWSGVFATYLSTSLLVELCDFLAECERSTLVSESQLTPFLQRVAGILQAPSAPKGIAELRSLLALTLDNVERLANNPSQPNSVCGTIPGRLVSEAISALRATNRFEKSRFQIFIDECESLLDYQQRQINSLIKHSTARLVYNIGLRPNGMRTRLTTSDSEQIEDPHDFKLFRPEVALSEGADTKTLQEILKQICKKRFVNAHVLPSDCDEKWTNIVEYLGVHDVEEELRSFGPKHAPGTIDRLRKLIEQQTSSAGECDRYVQLLGTDAPIANARLHICLLLRVPKYRPAVSDLADEYLRWSKDRSSSKRYSDWWHNAKLGLTFLLSAEHRRPKTYAGHDVYAMLSSGTIRYFIELCEQAFDFAHMRGFSWTAPRRLTDEEQTKAARYVSKYKVTDIGRYPNGPRLRQLAMSLGTIFGALHVNKNSTLGEPEPNQFSVPADEITGDNTGVRELLEQAILWAVLQNRSSTKDKDTEKKADAVDYHLNHIYCPYFGMSYRQKRKIELTVPQLARLCGADATSVRAAVRALLSEHQVPTSNDDLPPQLSFL
jgi:hypothetical protein